MSDEAYVLTLCDAFLGREGQRQHRFSFLVGDKGHRLPVDTFYPGLHLVVEYCERQHSEEVRLFDRRITASGIPRGQQRKLYDQRRRKVLPEHGIRVVEFSYSDFAHDSRKRIRRNESHDMRVIRGKLQEYAADPSSVKPEPICPMPPIWNRIYSAQLKGWEAAADASIPKPPVPLILAAWESSSSLKKARWAETRDWSAQYGFGRLITALSATDYFYG